MATMRDSDVPQWWAGLGLPGLIDIHTHFLPERMLQRVWAHFDESGPLIGRPWPITYRSDEAGRLAQLRRLGRHSAIYGIGGLVSRVIAVLFDSIPSFWLGLILLLVFAVTLNWLPLGDRCRTTLDPSCPPIWQRLNYVILPVFVLSVGSIAVLSRYIRASMLEIISNDYIRTARAKGVSERRVWFFHALRNGLITIATFIGPAVTGLLGGAVITETVFNYQGIGLTVVQAFTQRDYPIVMAVTIYAALATIMGYLISDILYGIVDPRIRY